jgi:penicillin-binding protein-related factor A (putative recombinase)
LSTPEGKVKARVRKVLKQRNAYYHMPVQNGMGSPSLDFTGCFKGRYFAVETKAGNKQPTERQAETMKEIADAGGKVFLVNDVTGEIELENWLDSLH